MGFCGNPRQLWLHWEQVVDKGGSRAGEGQVASSNPRDICWCVMRVSGILVVMPLQMWMPKLQIKSLFQTNIQNFKVVWWALWPLRPPATPLFFYTVPMFTAERIYSVSCDHKNREKMSVFLQLEAADLMSEIESLRRSYTQRWPLLKYNSDKGQ